MPNQIKSLISKNGLYEEQWVCDTLNKLQLFGTHFTRLNKNTKTDIQNEWMKISVKKTQLKLQGHVDIRWVESMCKQLGLVHFKKFHQFCERSDRSVKLKSFFEETDLCDILNELNSNKTSLIKFVLQGDCDDIAPGVMCVVYYTNNTRHMMYLVHINDIVCYVNNFSPVVGRSETNIHIGPMTLQRKGGNVRKPSGNKLQCKLRVFDIIHLAFFAFKCE